MTNQIMIDEWLLSSLNKYSEYRISCLQKQNTICENHLIEFNKFAKDLNSIFNTNGFRFIRTNKTIATFKFNDYEICYIKNINSSSPYYNSSIGLYSEDFVDETISFLLTNFPDKINLINMLKWK